MQSSRNTTDNPTAEELFGALNRRLKKAAQTTTARKLESGEYMIYEGRPVPATVVAQAEAEYRLIAERFAGSELAPESVTNVDVSHKAFGVMKPAARPGRKAMSKRNVLKRKRFLREQVSLAVKRDSTKVAPALPSGLLLGSFLQNKQITNK